MPRCPHRRWVTPSNAASPTAMIRGPREEISDRHGTTQDRDLSWRAWLGVGDAHAMDQIGQAEFDTIKDAQAWVERELPDTEWRQRDGLRVFGIPIRVRQDSGTGQPHTSCHSEG